MFFVFLGMEVRCSITLLKKFFTCNIYKSRIYRLNQENRILFHKLLAFTYLEFAFCNFSSKFESKLVIFFIWHSLLQFSRVPCDIWTEKRDTLNETFDWILHYLLCPKVFGFSVVLFTFTFRLFQLGSFKLMFNRITWLRRKSPSFNFLNSVLPMNNTKNRFVHYKVQMTEVVVS